MKKGSGATITHDYKRNGKTFLFAALDTANGEVFGLCWQKHRHKEWLRFLHMIYQTVPAGKVRTCSARLDVPFATLKLSRPWRACTTMEDRHSFMSGKRFIRAWGTSPASAW